MCEFPQDRGNRDIEDSAKRVVCGLSGEWSATSALLPGMDKALAPKSKIILRPTDAVSAKSKSALVCVT